MNNNMPWLLSKYIHRKDWLSFLKLNTTFYDFGSLLSSGINPSICTNYAIRCAACNGREKVIELLLQDPRVDPSTENNFAIIHSAWTGRVKVVELLLQDPRVDPSVHNNIVIRYFIKNNHTKVVELILQDPRVKIH